MKFTRGHFNWLLVSLDVRTQRWVTRLVVLVDTLKSELPLAQHGSKAEVNHGWSTRHTDDVHLSGGLHSLRNKRFEASLKPRPTLAIIARLPFQSCAPGKRGSASCL